MSNLSLLPGDVSALSTGALVGFWIVFGIKEHISLKRSSTWIIPMAIQLVPSGLLFISVLFVRETPRFLLKSNKPEQALANLSWIRNLDPEHPYILREMDAIRRQLEDVRILSGKEAREGAWSWAGAYVRTLAKYLGAIKNRLAIGFCLMLFQSKCELFFVSLPRTVARKPVHSGHGPFVVPNF